MPPGGPPRPKPKTINYSKGYQIPLVPDKPAKPEKPKYSSIKPPVLAIRIYSGPRGTITPKVPIPNNIVKGKPGVFSLPITIPTKKSKSKALGRKAR